MAVTAAAAAAAAGDAAAKEVLLRRRRKCLVMPGDRSMVKWGEGGRRGRAAGTREEEPRGRAAPDAQERCEQRGGTAGRCGRKTRWSAIAGRGRTRLDVMTQQQSATVVG